MKEKLSRMWRSGVALLLALCLVAGFVPSVAFATEADEIKYVSIGDSMANGYGLPGYDSVGKVNGFLEEAPDAYPAQLAEHFGWDLTQLATSAMRAEDLHYILEYPGGYQGDYYTEDEFIDGRWNDYAGINNNYAGVANVAKIFQSSVADADVISLGIGNANFGVFMLGRITNALGVLGGDASEDAWIDFQNALSECDAETKAFALQAYDVLKAEVAKRTPAGAEEIVDPLVNAIAYTLTSYVLNYGGAIEAIAKLNPDAEVIIVGLMNTFSGMKLSYEGEIIDMGAVMDKMIGTVNAYLAALPATLQAAGKYPEATYYYAAASNVSMIVDNFATEIKQSDTVVRDRTIEEVVDLVWPMLNGMTEAAGDDKLYVDITRADVEAYEAALAKTETFAAYMAENGDKVQSIATYLAFEKATIEASKLGVLDANAFITLATGLNGVFDGVYASFEEKVYTKLENGEYDADTMAFATEVSEYLSGQIDASIIYIMLSIPNAMSEALTEDETVCSLLNLFARMLIGNGIGCHPSAAGHDTLTDAIVTAYETGHTAKDETIENVEIVLNELYKLVETYGPEVAAQVWAQWEEYGYVDMVETSMSELKAMLEERYTYYTETALPAIEKSVENLNAQKEELSAELAALKAELAVKKAELEAVVNDVEIGDIYVPDINIDVELGNNTQTQVPDHECTVDGDSIEAELEAAVKDLEHAIAVIEALLADIEADIADMIALAEQIAAAVAELEKTMASLAEAAEDVEAAVKAVIAVIKDSDGVVDATVKSFEAAREVAQAAVEVLELTAGTAEEMMDDIDTMIQKIASDAEALYNKFMNDLPGCIEQIPEEAKMLIGGTVLAVQQAYEANKEEIYAALEAELKKLAEEYGISEESVKAELAKLAKEYEANKAAIEAELADIEAKIAAEVEAKYAEIEAEYNAQIEIAKAKAAAKLAELEAELKGYQAELEALAENAAEEVKAGIQAQIDRVNADIATVKADLEHAVSHLENAAQEAYEQIVAEVTKVYEETVAALNEKLAELKAAYDKAVAALEQKLAELKAAYDKAVEDLLAEADKAIAELTEALNKTLEELGKIGEELADEINGILAAIRQELTDAQKAVEEILKGNLAAIEELKNALIEMGCEAIAEAIDNLIDAVNNLIEEATTADLIIDDDFKYVAIGDGSAAPESYVEKLEAALNAEAAENGVDEIEVVNYAKAGNTVAAERANLSDVSDADLITIGFSNVEFLSKAIANAGSGAKMDWAAVVGAENVQYVEQLLAEVAAKIAEAGIEGESAVMANAAIEAYAYAAVQYATELPELVNDIHAANPEALVIIVGMYNPMEGVTIALDENTALDIGEYVDYLVKGVGVHGVAYSILTGNSIYVDAPAVQTVNTDTELGLMDMLNLIQTGYASLYPSAAGDDYIAAEIADALNITYVKTEVEVLLGDVNGDGVVDNKDLVRLRKYLADPDTTEIVFENADVNLDGEVDNKDLVRMRKHFADGVAFG